MDNTVNPALAIAEPEVGRLAQLASGTSTGGTPSTKQLCAAAVEGVLDAGLDGFQEGGGVGGIDLDGQYFAGLGEGL